jgi:hypothetical protein
MFHACVQRFDGMDEKILGSGPKPSIQIEFRLYQSFL